MTTPVMEGGCACGAVRYAVAGPPLISYCCHCTECRRRTGSAFGLNAQVRAEAFEVRRGTPKVRTRVADSGNELALHFCGGCGATLFSVPAARPHLRVVYAGTLDDPGRVPVRLNIWTDSALPWVHLDPAIEEVPRQPDMARYVPGIAAAP